MTRTRQLINYVRYWIYKKLVTTSICEIKPYYSSGYFMQTTVKPKKYFAKYMQSGNLGLCRVKNIKEFNDFGKACYSVDYEWTGLNCN